MRSNSIILVLALWMLPSSCSGFVPSSTTRGHHRYYEANSSGGTRRTGAALSQLQMKTKTTTVQDSRADDESVDHLNANDSRRRRHLPSTLSRRSALLTAAASAAAFIPLAASATTAAAPSCTTKSLEDLALGDGMWKRLSDHPTATKPSIDAANPQLQSIVPAYFAAYAARFLINYDEGMASWWREKKNACSLLSEQERESKLGKAFGALARSIQIALDNFVLLQEQQTFISKSSRKDSYTQLLRMFLTTYASSYKNDDEIRRQIGLLFSMLPAQDQPSFQDMNQFATERSAEAPEKPIFDKFVVDMDSYESNNPAPRILSQDLASLLPAEFRVASIKDSNAHRIYPAVSLYEVGFDEEFGQTAVGTPFGPISSVPLKRERPNYSPFVYALFGISGATGCAITHSVVIPLDVVKTRAQTDPEEFSNLFAGAGKIIEQEGIQGLLLGAQATLAGYFWYGLSVYPSYTFFKRWFTLTLLQPEVAMGHVSEIAVVAGACAAVIASLGLTPLEAARIRVVAEPDIYRSLGLSGTLAAIAEEDIDLGWKGLYAGLPSLLTRQVIFGSIKFLAFERASEAIFAAAPSLRDATWTALTVSLVAGGVSGCISSIVSQPADSVLTYVAQNNRGTSSMGIIEGTRVMIEEGGVGSLFRGLGSRCVWAGSIIAGQFLLYDVFRTIFGVNSDDLSQIYQVILYSHNP